MPNTLVELRDAHKCLESVEANLRKNRKSTKHLAIVRQAWEQQFDALVNASPVAIMQDGRVVLG